MTLTGIGIIALIVCGSISSCIPETQTNHRFSFTPLPSAAGVPAIRVRLLDKVASVDLSTTGGYRVIVDGQVKAESTQPLSSATLVHDGNQWWLGSSYFRGSIVRLGAVGSSLVVQDGRPYRGMLVMISTHDGDPRTFSIDNHVNIESYLAGVLARELLRSWEQEAFNALAITARTYALYEIEHVGKGRDFDVYDDQRSQVYGGVSDETPKSLQAVRSTWGQVLVTGAKGHEHVFKTYYSSCCGGVTNPADGLEPQEEYVPALAGGVVCTDCSTSTKYRWAPVRVSKADIYRALAKSYNTVSLMGNVKEIRPSSATAWGRVEWVDVVAANGDSVRLRADDLRLSLIRSGLPGTSTLYSMNAHLRDEGDSIVFEGGQGFGHGVGLCQYGTQGKALRGMKGYEIVYSYFPGARIISAYK